MIVVDSSALVAMFRKEEPDWLSYLEALQAATRPRLSAANLVETIIVLGSRAPRGGRQRLAMLVRESGMIIEPVDELRALQAADAHAQFGRGNHPAKLNFGDCFAYALAKELDMPLLYKGDDFRQTDIRSVL